MYSDLIVALSTPPGDGAIGIVRLSGEKSIDIAREIFRNKKGCKVDLFQNRLMHYGFIMDQDVVLDEVMLVCLEGPSTYTKENMVEIFCYGGQIPLRRVISKVVSLGARYADPGEFTKRAFMNGRLDLAQAEAVMELVSSKTEMGFDLAKQHVLGYLSKKIGVLRQSLIGVLAKIEVSIDYPEEDIEEVTYSEVEKEVEQILSIVNHLIKNSEAGKITKEGLRTVIIGKPNVGKSSLLNALLKESRAIVTEIPGTTRDVLEEYINIKGIPLRVVDTAGIRETEDIVEKIGVEKSKEFFNKADLVIMVLNANDGLTAEDLDILKYLKHKKSIVIVNKIDLMDHIDYEKLKALIDHEIIIKTSMLTDDGLDQLETAIVEMALDGVKINREDVLVTNVRQIQALESAAKSLEMTLEGIERKIAYDFLQVDLKDAYEYLGEITGDTIEESLLDKIFANFCLGK